MVEQKNVLGSQLKQLGILTTIPVVLLAGPVIGYLIGGWLDRKYHIYPWVTIIFLVLGFTASGREVVRLLGQVLDLDPSAKKNLQGKQ